MISIERNGEISLVTIDQLMEILTPECSENLLELMAEFNALYVQFKEYPKNGLLRHNEDFPKTDKNSIVPGVYCVELQWKMPVITKIQIEAKSIKEAKQNVILAIYEGADDVYDDVQRAFNSFYPNVKNARVLDAMPVNKRVYANVHVINLEDRK